MFGTKASENSTFLKSVTLNNANSESCVISVDERGTIMPVSFS